ncbi:homoserine dehydrogenase [Akkermansiaceae bacterium]|nr:homoserine dehydrogenase [Akkermansiaceae bacterium]
MSCSQTGIGLAGFGTVGSGVWKIIERNGGLIGSRSQGDVSLAIRKICVRDLAKKRDVEAPDELFTTDLMEVVNDPSVDIVVELIGGTDAAFDLVAAALRAKKPVVTGNKALLAERGAELFALSAEMETSIHFEAAVAGGIPIIKAVQESLIGNQIEDIVGIINGTSNYILMRMTEAGLGYPEALKEAKNLGYAEADETLDVNGWDAAHKAILLGSLAHGFLIDPTEVYVRGIEKVTPLDISFASDLGYVVKLLSFVRLRDNGAVEIRTASSVISDLAEAARSMRHADSNRGFLPYRTAGKLVPIAETETSYYVRFSVKDQPGVIAEIATLLAQHEIGISGTHSPVDADNPDADFVEMVFLLHSCPFGKLKGALTKVEELDCLTARPVVFRIEKI